MHNCQTLVTKHYLCCKDVQTYPAAILCSDQGFILSDFWLYFIGKHSELYKITVVVVVVAATGAVVSQAELAQNYVLFDGSFKAATLYIYTINNTDANEAVNGCRLLSSQMESVAHLQGTKLNRIFP